MNNKERREKIIQLLEQEKKPISGSRLASMLSVSRQVIVADIALLRAEYPILATAQGYLLYGWEKKQYRRTYAVSHTAEDIPEELLYMIEMGGRVLNVMIEHDVNGQIHADLDLSTPGDVCHFCHLIKNSRSGPLFHLSNGIHMHTVEAASEEILDQIENMLKEKGWLA
ncbi:MAG: transcription repressor NadR [Lachnospiraceae bacterium]|nr:transcription repressor NadR [Lachnospiraceae bacterium]